MHSKRYNEGIKRKPYKLWVDQEFYSEHLYKLFKLKKSHIVEKDEKGEYKNKIYSVFNTSKNPVIERFNRTLTNKLWKEFSGSRKSKMIKNSSTNCKKI